ncbi:glycosyltransferase family 4 protein [Clostridium tagluense]|uniref:glycosyltransferase family 4 protein n=1 Tax=Clostridium TaxID=1485 RepID=UPI0013E96D2F|nr:MULTISPECIES: glycosyltransferase family 4 protein [Clostridium]MBU3127411.1 glycosyltransferase family 4 protein [Clostridium tagluense]MBW9155294.1 glycosyltransferase family 4 protein [Clostridium tagluense]MBZ9621584.1 glycosyltransferase family 4 protein [Clostridium sp. FP2]MCB2311115.1 glycosyltransferase family 4 protein [Clostridium tagluense]MCB2315839.1 glycosyltransferase family 4 protein [Clostridium tagluense]
MPTINMLSSADKVKGQGVGSAYLEQVNLVQNGLDKEYKVVINKKVRTEIMHYHTIDFKHYLSIPFAKKKGVTVGYVHFLPETIEGSIKLPKLIEKIFYKYIISFYNRMDYLVTVNPNFITKLEAYNIDRKKITYIPNFVSEEKFYNLSTEDIYIAKEKLKIEKDAFVVLGVGQIQTRKGVIDFIDIARKMPEVQFIWAGGFSFGNITDGYKELKDQIEHAPKNILFTGIVERDLMNDIYNVSNVLFMPSYNELFPMSILESMNTYTPILLRDLELYEDILFDYYLKEHDNEGFIKAIGKLKNDSSYYKEAKEKAIRGHKFYSRENVLAMWKEFYKKVYRIKGR